MLVCMYVFVCVFVRSVAPAAEWGNLQSWSQRLKAQMYSDYVKIHFCLNAFLNFLEKMFALPGLRRFQVASLNQFNHAAAFIYYFKRIFAFVFVIKTFCLTFTMFFCFVYTRIHFYFIFCFGFILIFFLFLF